MRKKLFHSFLIQSTFWKFSCNVSLSAILFCYFSIASLANGAEQSLTRAENFDKKISFNREYLIDHFISLGYDRSESVSAINSLSDEDVKTLIEHPELLKKTGFVFIAGLLLILLLVLLLAILSAQQQKRMKKKVVVKKKASKKIIVKKEERKYPIGFKECTVCHGKKILPHTTGIGGAKVVCPECKGKGYVPEDVFDTLDVIVWHAPYSESQVKEEESKAVLWRGVGTDTSDSTFSNTKELKENAGFYDYVYH